VPKALVNVVLDRVIDARALEELALAHAAGTKERLVGAVHRLLQVGADADEAEAAFVRAFRELVLAEAGRAAPDAMALARRCLVAEAKAAIAVGVTKLRQVPALKKPDVMARLSERAGTAS
jgi:hypothetical protein